MIVVQDMKQLLERFDAMSYTNTSGELVTDEELQDMHDDLIDELYGDLSVGIYEWAASRVLKLMDPVAYRVSVLEYIDQLVDDNQLSEV